MSEKDLEILPVKQIEKLSEYDQLTRVKYDDRLPEVPFLFLIFAPTASGKSVLLTNLIYRQYLDVFDQIVFFSPTVSHDTSLKPIWNDDEIVKIDKNLKFIDQIVEELVAEQKNTHPDDRKHMLIVFDDCLGFFRRGGYLNYLCSRYRHYKISILITSQKFKDIPTLIRSNSTGIVIFKTRNKKEYTAIEDEYGGLIANFEECYKYATKDKYNFLYINAKKGECYKNFTQQINHENKIEDEENEEEKLEPSVSPIDHV